MPKLLSKVGELHFNPQSFGSILADSFPVGMRYSIETRRYSLFGDNCQQFILNFCEDICIKIDATATDQLTIAPQLIRPLLVASRILAAGVLVDILINKGRMLVKHLAIPVTGLCLMTAVTVAHPRMYSARLHHMPFPFPVSYGLYLLHICVVWGCVDLVLCAYGLALDFGAAFVGSTYHTIYSYAFVQQA